jgi:hypothetical protein
LEVLQIEAYQACPTGYSLPAIGNMGDDVVFERGKDHEGRAAAVIEARNGFRRDATPYERTPFPTTKKNLPPISRDFQNVRRRADHRV